MSTDRPSTGPASAATGVEEAAAGFFRTVVIGTDGSTGSREVLDAGGRLARSIGSDAVHVVVGYHPLNETELSRLARDLPDEFRTGLWSDQTGESIISEACNHLRSIGVSAVGHPVPGKGAAAVLEIAADVGADLIVVGSHRYGTLGRLLHGSVSTAVAHHAPCSVLIVPTAAPP